MRSSLFFAAAIGVAVLARPAPAHACGGCFHPQGETPTVVTDHRMILSISQTQSTLYDQVEYSGSPSNFAWVLPITGVATVGLSSDVLFASLDQMTQTTIYPPPLSCPPPPPNCYYGTDGSAAADASAGGVQVLKQEVVGPYETVQLQSTDPQALTTWLTSHNFAIPTDIQPIIDAYVQEGFDFLAMRLVPGAGVEAMRPVRVTTAGASPVLPLRMVAAGTGAMVGVTLWIIGEGRYEPQNFPFFRINDSDIVWDFQTNSSNYKALRQDQEKVSNGLAWEIESSIALNVSQLTQLVQNGGNSFPYYGYDAGADYPTAGDDAGVTADQQRDADLATLVAGINAYDVRATRIRSDLSRAALANDLVLQASADQSVLPNVRNATHDVNPPPCPNYSNCPTNPYDPNNPSQTGGGCAVTETNAGGGGGGTTNQSVFVALAAGLGLVLQRLVRRRKL